MAGAGKSEIRSAIVGEVVAGTTPATPAFITLPTETFNLTATPRITEDRTAASGYRVSNLGRSGLDVAGSFSGKLRYGAYDTILESLFQSTWASNVLKDSVTGRRTFSHEDTVPQGSGGTAAYWRYRGLEVVSATLAAEAEGDSTLEGELIGMGADDATETAIAGATYTAPASTPLLGTGALLGSITLGAYTVPCVQAFTMTFEQEGKAGQPKLFSDDYCGITRGAMMVGLELSLYLENGIRQIYNDAKNGAADFAVTLMLGTVTTQKYELFLPRCQWTAAPLDTSESDGFMNAVIKPLYDSTEGCVVRLTRAVA